MTLRELRESHGARVPPAWEAANPAVVRLVRWLMARSPRDRPTAREVLSSGLLPPRVQDEQVGVGGDVCLVCVFVDGNVCLACVRGSCRGVCWGAGCRQLLGKRRSPTLHATGAPTPATPCP